MDDIIKGVWPFMIAELIVLAIMILFPWTVTVPASWFHP
jgi:TRAP-type C4-dicarboxylate transport system permease large subunit